MFSSLLAFVVTVMLSIGSPISMAVISVRTPPKVNINIDGPFEGLGPGAGSCDCDPSDFQTHGHPY